MSVQFKQRMFMSILGIIALIFCIYFSYSSFFKPIFIFFNAAIVSIALKEYYHLAERKGFKPLSNLGIIAAIAYLVTLAFTLHHDHLKSLPSLILLLSLLVFFLPFFKQQTSSLSNLAVTVFGFVYLAIPLSCIVRINYFFPLQTQEDGRLWLAYLLIVSKITDVGAYFCGKFFGNTKLAPMISPKKTLEGAMGGTLAALVTSILLSPFLSTEPMATTFKMTLWQSIWIGFSISILAQLGDLAESILKRDAGVKDSSHLPGLGGILDIVDSLVFTLPFMYLLLQMDVIG